MALHEVGTWLRDNLLPMLLLLLGAALAGRAVHWAGARYRRALDDEVREVIEGGGLVPERAKRARAVGQAVEWTTMTLLYFLAGLLALRAIGIPLTSLVAPATVAGVAIGFGAQQIVGDVLAGFFLFTEHQFGVGDLIRLSTPGQLTGISGTVEELTLRVTKLRSQQGEVIVIPNSALRQVTNLSKDWSRVVIDVPIPVEEDLQTAIGLIGDVAHQMATEEAWRDQILGDPVMAGVEQIDVGYVQLRLLVRTLPGRQFDVGRELRLRVALTLREQQVKSPVAPTAPAGGSS
ncbi:MAG: mechanosensitive ion channel family protein [Acidimicrobiales bacterium]